jgi:hypothetical protein
MERLEMILYLALLLQKAAGMVQKALQGPLAEMAGPVAEVVIKGRKALEIPPHLLLPLTLMQRKVTTEVRGHQRVTVRAVVAVPMQALGLVQAGVQILLEETAEMAQVLLFLDRQ